MGSSNSDPTGMGGGMWEGTRNRFNRQHDLLDPLRGIRDTARQAYRDVLAGNWGGAPPQPYDRTYDNEPVTAQIARGEPTTIAGYWENPWTPDAEYIGPLDELGRPIYSASPDPLTTPTMEIYGAALGPGAGGEEGEAEDPEWMSSGKNILDVIADRMMPNVNLPEQATVGRVGYGQNNQGSRYLMAIAQQLFGGTAPHREAMLDQSLDFLRGDYDVSGLPLWAATKNAAEQSYDRSQQDILAQLPAGGALQEALAESATNKARALTDAAARIGQNELDFIRGYAGQVAPQIATGASGQAGNIQAQLRAQDIQRAIAEANIMAQQRAQDIGALTTQRGQDITQQTGLGYLLSGLRGQDINEAISQAQIEAQVQAQEDAGKNSALGGIGEGLGGWMFGGK